MAVYTYKALNQKGRSIRGVVDAESVRHARSKLRQQGLYPVEVKESSSKEGTRSITLQNVIPSRGPRIGISQLSVITRQFATLIAAGMPLIEALKALGDQIDNPGIKSTIADVSDKVNEGWSLANALREYPTVFPRLYTNMVASGEASGSLDLVLERLSDLLESQAALRRKVISALTYPILMLFLCFAVITLLLAYVVPQITSIFKEQNAVLPLPTRVIIALSSFVQAYWLYLLVLGIAAFLGLKYFSRTERGRRKIDIFLLKIPIIGSLKLKIATARLANNLGSMLSSGIEMLTALGIAKNIIGNVVLEDAIEAAAEGVREGGSLAAELNKSQMFPRLLIHMIAVGERTGQLEPMLLRAAKVYESEIDAVISGFTAILEPVLIIFLALVVGGILAAVMLPMLEMTSLMHK
ncbi:MAG: type II secretion system inner membrane protein GspF [Deltaproteobacteria bacterium]|nr:type II secretion system inner membrane protein GspF [Deltaproteobacteria bacterium]